jgi:hypothetical protein
MTPDTYFFIELKIENTFYTYGPYLDLESATVIMIDLMPLISKIKAKKTWYKYSCEVQEKIMDYEKEWVLVNTHIVENECLRKK